MEAATLEELEAWARAILEERGPREVVGYKQMTGMCPVARFYQRARRCTDPIVLFHAATVTTPEGETLVLPHAPGVPEVIMLVDRGAPRQGVPVATLLAAIAAVRQRTAG